MIKYMQWKIYGNAQHHRAGAQCYNRYTSLYKINGRQRKCRTKYHRYQNNEWRSFFAEIKTQEDNDKKNGNTTNVIIADKKNTDTNNSESLSAIVKDTKNTNIDDAREAWRCYFDSDKEAEKIMIK